MFVFPLCVIGAATADAAETIGVLVAAGAEGALGAVGHASSCCGFFIEFRVTIAKIEMAIVA
jgi:hypothetical protein